MPHHNAARAGVRVIRTIVLRHGGLQNYTSGVRARVARAAGSRFKDVVTRGPAVRGAPEQRLHGGVGKDLLRREVVRRHHVRGGTRARVARIYRRDEDIVDVGARRAERRRLAVEQPLHGSEEDRQLEDGVRVLGRSAICVTLVSPRLAAELFECATRLLSLFVVQAACEPRASALVSLVFGSQAYQV